MGNFPTAAANSARKILFDLELEWALLAGGSRVAGAYLFSLDKIMGLGIELF
jgi:hypothetical protein